jgi:hypothetical protein
LERLSDVEPMKGPRLDAARRASLKGRADAFAANVRPIIKEIQASGVTSMRGIARALTARGVKTARGGDWSDVQVAERFAERSVMEYRASGSFTAA